MPSLFKIRRICVIFLSVSIWQVILHVYFQILAQVLFETSEVKCDIPFIEY